MTSPTTAHQGSFRSIDATTGDLGSDVWSRTRSYEP